MAAHPGELDTLIYRRHGIKNALDPAHVRRFPLTEQEVEEVKACGGLVDYVSLGQRVIFLDGTELVHGVDDGLHEGD